MNDKYTIAIIATKAPHFPVDQARKVYSACQSVLKKTLSHDFDLLFCDEIIADPFLCGKSLKDIKKARPDLLIMVQSAFTWDDIAIGSRAMFGDVPVVLWASPDNYKSGVLGINSLCGSVMNNSAFRARGERPIYCYTDPSLKGAGRDIRNAVNTAVCVLKIRSSRYGMVGDRPAGFHGSDFNKRRVKKEFGIDTIYYEVPALVRDINVIPDNEVTRDAAISKRLGRIGEATKNSLDAGSRAYLALKKFVEKKNIDFLAVRCWPELMKLGLNPCMALGRLTDNGIPAGCESDFGATLSMAIASWIAGSASWMADIIEIDKKKESFYLWHCGAAPRSLSSQKKEPVINKQFRGMERGNTLEFPLKEGPVTICRFGLTRDRFRIFAFEGKAISPKIKIRGNVSEVEPLRAPIEILKAIFKYGVEHHFAVVYGSWAGCLEQVAAHLDIDFYTV